MSKNTRSMIHLNQTGRGGGDEAMTMMIERVARAIADDLGDNFDHAFVHKQDWTAARGESGGRYRGINEPFQRDYLDAARAALTALLQPTAAMIAAGEASLGMEPDDEWVDPATAGYRAMIQHALNEEG